MSYQLDFTLLFGKKEEEELAESLKQSRKNRKEHTKNED